MSNKQIKKTVCNYTPWYTSDIDRYLDKLMFFIQMRVSSNFIIQK